MSFINSAKSVISIEVAAIQALLERIGPEFNQACQLLMSCNGRIIVLGIGKSGHIGNKIAATLASTGSPAFAVNAGEASHGDFGMITHGDVVLAISNSGKTYEIIRLLPLLKKLQVPLISLSGNPSSELAKAANVNLDVSVTQEACPLALAPTASTTATLVMGDALAIALMKERGFTKEQFAFTHPGGALGNRLLLTVADVMVTLNKVPKVAPTDTLGQAILEMTRRHMGFTTIADQDNRLLGVYTDGDLRRSFEKNLVLDETKIESIMTANPVTISSDRPAVEALDLMNQKQITSIVVSDDGQHITGALHMHDLIRAGIAS